jgi:hypothetical protein
MTADGWEMRVLLQTVRTWELICSDGDLWKIPEMLPAYSLVTLTYMGMVKLLTFPACAPGPLCLVVRARV